MSEPTPAETLSNAASPTSRWSVRTVTAADVPQMRALFEEVFQQPMDEALWHWKYTAGRGEASAVWDADGRMVGHYAGFPRQVRMFGKEVAAYQIGDVMVLPRERGTLSRKGPLFLSATHFLDAHIGYGLPALLGYGFPNLRHMQVADRLGLYGDSGKMLALGWAAEAVKLPWWCSVQPFNFARPKWRQEVDALWQSMARGLDDALVAVRNADWLDYRFRARPGAPYQVLALRHRLTRRLIALLIVRNQGSSLDWLDVMAAPRDWPLCVDVVRRHAASLQLANVNMWLSAPYAPQLGATAHITDIGVCIPNCTRTPGPDTANLHDRWFLTGGDTDFL